LVTGASGFIGRRLASTLARRGHDVACLVRKTSRTACLGGLPIELVVGDFGDPDSLDAAVAGRNWVFHLAGVVQASGESAFAAANVGVTRDLVRACLRQTPGPERFVFVSSIAAAGPSAPDRPGTEADEPRPVTAYGRSKLAAEGIVRQAAPRLPATIIRPPNVLGPGSKELGLAIGLVRKRIIPGVSDGRPRTSLVDVDDLVEALILAASNVRSIGQTYYVTDGRAYAWPEITAALAEELGVGRIRVRVPLAAQILAAWFAETGARLTGKPPALTRDIVRAGRDHFWIYDSSKIERELGFHPRSTMRDSVRRALVESGLKAGPGRGRDGARA
jgi:dihydroflavonol-4-reductase